MFSKIFERTGNNEIGRYPSKLFGFLLGLGIGDKITVLQSCGKTPLTNILLYKLHSLCLSNSGVDPFSA